MGLMHHQRELCKVEKATGELSFQGTRPFLVVAASYSVIFPALPTKARHGLFKETCTHAIGLWELPGSGFSIRKDRGCVPGPPPHRPCSLEPGRGLCFCWRDVGGKQRGAWDPGKSLFAGSAPPGLRRSGPVPDLGEDAGELALWPQAPPAPRPVRGRSTPGASLCLRCCQGQLGGPSGWRIFWMSPG